MAQHKSKPNRRTRSGRSTRKSRRALRVLVIDIGGSHIKVRAPGCKNLIEIRSGPGMTPKRMVAAVNQAMAGCQYDVVSVGYPGLVTRGVPHQNPPNLGKGWVGFNLAKSFGRPVKVVNDAVMQALGCYHGGKMLFLGLGTGLGSALILDGVLHGMELGDLPYRNGRSCSDYIKKATLKRIGRARWSQHVQNIVCQLTSTLQPDYTVLGGGQAKLVQKPPDGAEVVDNSKAFLGGIRMWQPPTWFRKLAKTPEAES